MIFNEFRYRLSPLHHTIIQGNSTACKILLNCGGNSEKGQEPIDVQKCTPLHYCAMYNKEDLLVLLLRNGSDKYALNIDKRTVLHEACLSGNLEIVKHLLQSDSEDGIKIIDNMRENVTTAEYVNMKDDEGDTPLMMAIESGSKEIVKILLELNADPCIPNESQNYPMHIAAKEGAVDIMTLLIEASDIDPQTFISIIKIFIS